MQVEFYGSPAIRAKTELVARENIEIMKIDTIRSENEVDYMATLMRKINEDISPFKDSNLKDANYTREILDHYRMAEKFHEATTNR